MKKIILVGLLLMLVSCKDQAPGAVEHTTEESALQLTNADIKISFVEFELDGQVKSITQNWKAYNQLEETTSNLKRADVSFFKENHDMLETLIADFSTTVPERLSSPAVLARIVALENAMYKLENVVNISSHSQQKEVVASIEDVLKAHTNLKFQMNKKVERDAQKIQRPN